MFAADLTGKEIDVFLYLLSIQDQYGEVTGAYYQDIQDNAGIKSRQTVYTTLKNLENKELIKKSKNHYTDFDIVILHNDFSYGNPINYTSTNKTMFYDPDFRKMKPGAKLMALDLLQLTGKQEDNNHPTYKKEINAFWKKYKELLQITKHTVQLYMTQLRKFFNVQIKGHTYYIKALNRAKSNIGLITENYRLAEHTVKTLLRRQNIRKYENQDIKDIANVLISYSKKFTKARTDEQDPVRQKAVSEHRAMNAMGRAVQKAKQHLQGRINDIPKPNFIHKLLKQEFEEEIKIFRQTPANASG